MFVQLFLFAAIVAIGLGQSTTKSPLDKSICENLKPKDSPDFAKGSGTYSLKLKLMEKDKFVWIEIKGENKTTFEGNSILILIFMNYLIKNVNFQCRRFSAS
jgi:hypothetical protein